VEFPKAANPVVLTAVTPATFAIDQMLSRWPVAYPKAAIPVVQTAVTPVPLVVVQRGIR
jgi:hypothetical protein